MTFSYEGVNLSKTIKKYERNENEYLIEYLDGSSYNYISYEYDEEEKIKKQMLEQAKERKELFDLHFLNFTDTVYLISGLLSAVGLSFSLIENENNFKHFWIILLIISIYKFKQTGNKLQELEKYRLFLELIEELGEEELNNPKYTKCYEFDSLYAKKIDIGSLDSFDYRDIKRIYTKYKTKVKYSPSKK